MFRFYITSMNLPAEFTRPHSAPEHPWAPPTAPWPMHARLFQNVFRELERETKKETIGRRKKESEAPPIAQGWRLGRGSQARQATAAFGNRRLSGSR
jgi:hypothetical protein